MKNKKLFIISIGRASQMVLMFATYRILSRIFSVEDMGGYYFLLSIAGAYGLIFANPLGMYANRKIHEWHRGGQLTLNLTKLTITYFLGMLLIIPFLYFFRDKLISSNTSLIGVIGILIFYVFSSTVNNTFIPTLNLLGEALQFVSWTFFTSVIGLISSFLIVKYYVQDPMYWLLGQAIAFFLFAIVAFIIISKKYRDSDKIIPNETLKHNFNSILKFVAPIAFTNIFVWSMAQSFRFFLKDNVNPTLLGEMTFGLGLASSLSVAVEYLFQQLFLPNFYQDLGHDSESKEKSWNRLLNRVAPSYIVYGAFLFGLSDFLIRVLADPKFRNAGTFLALGAFVEFFRMSSNILTMATHAEMKTEKAFFPYLFGGGATLVAVLFVSKHPEYVEYMPYLLAMGYLISCIFLTRTVRKFFTINMNYKKLIQYALFSLVFIIPKLFLIRFSNSLFYSIAICFAFGLVLLYLFYHQYKAQD